MPHDSSPSGPNLADLQTAALLSKALAERSRHRFLAGLPDVDVRSKTLRPVKLAEIVHQHDALIRYSDHVKAAERAERALLVQVHAMIRNAAEDSAIPAIDHLFTSLAPEMQAIAMSVAMAYGSTKAPRTEGSA